MKRIICIGNRLLDADAAGPRVFDLLAAGPQVPDVDLVDGGIAGLNLLGLIDGAERVVFVDSVSGYAPAGGVVVLMPAEIPAPEQVYDHGAGLPYLLAVLPQVCDRPPAEVCLVGIEVPAGNAAIAEAARLACELASAGPEVCAAVHSRGGNHDIAC